MRSGAVAGSVRRLFLAPAIPAPAYAGTAHAHMAHAGLAQPQDGTAVALPSWQAPARALGLALALLMLLALGGRSGPPIGMVTNQRTAAGDAGRAAALLADAERTLSSGDRLLTTRDANPGLFQDPAWLAQHAQVVADLDAEYHAALDLAAPPSAAPAAACLAEGLRLSATGHDLLQRAFLSGGHGAYYDSAHGNWDLQLGQQRLQRCPSLLRSPAVP